MNFSPEPLPLILVLVLGGCKAFAQFNRWLETCVFHPQWLEDMLGTVLIERLAGNKANEFPQDYKVNIAVDKPYPGGMNRFLCHNHLESCVIA
jgi:hypothetical protein